MGKSIIPFFYWFKKDKIVFEIDISDVYINEVDEYVAKLTATQKKNVIIKIVGEAKPKKIRKKRTYKRKTSVKTDNNKSVADKKTVTKKEKSSKNK